MRPRCREFLPLATQQLRLRNLVRIHGHIQGHPVDDLDALVYYTLHSSNLSEAFYTSEQLPLRHTQQKWADIQQCQQMQKSNANCVCVKVWKRLSREQTMKEQQTDDKEAMETLEELIRPKEPISALTKELSNTSLSPQNLLRPPDKLLFTWGVYFSGLVLLGENVKCTPNSMVFQINGDFFASPEHIKWECPTDDWELRHQQQQPRYLASVPHYTKLSPVRSDNSPQIISNGSLKPPASDELKEDLLKSSMKRFTQWFCARADVRKSYDLNRLLRIQDLQRTELQYKQETEEFSQEIKRLSLHCITEEQLMTKGRNNSSSLHHHHHHQHHMGSMGRTLSVLLAEEQQIDPHSLYRAKTLLQEIETVRCRHRLLEKEFNTYSARIEVMRRRLNALQLSRQQAEDTLKRQNDQLQQDNNNLYELLQEIVQLQRTKRATMQNVDRRMSALCMELREIYPIKRNPAGFYTVCNIPFPNVDAYVNDVRYVEHVSPIALSASLGYIAHLVQMMAVVINRPLRNPIIYEGSKTRILDIIRDLPLGTREFPLYTRSSIPSKPVKHAIYLLNQNISQICYDINGRRCDFRTTIENILSIFRVLAEIEQNSRDPHATHSQTHPSHRLRLFSSSGHHHGRHSQGRHQNEPHNASRERTDSSSKGSDITDFGPAHHHHHHQQQNNSLDCLSQSHSSVDMLKEKCMTYLQMPTAPGTISQPMSIGVRGMGQRVCRSVGSYSDSDDDDLKDGIVHIYSNSDSNIQFQSDPI